jgi:hypothetical protein
MYSYNGGKFEVTRKGKGYFYEYDIVSAYPYEIANLKDITHARVIHQKAIPKDADYGFMLCAMNISYNTYSPIAVKWGSVNIYPVGCYAKVITLNEYKYLIKYKCKISIIDAFYLCCDTNKYPYREEVLKLFAFKKKYKEEGDYLKTHTVKILLNSLYGKFVQLIRKGKSIDASTCWNPVYGSIITANTRIKVSEMQQQYNSIVAVHTDSVISTKKLYISLGKDLGDWAFEREGKGVILGSGIYQIGKVSKVRGFVTKYALCDLINKKVSKLKIISKRSISWREVAFHNWDTERINRFEDIDREIDINFDKKRIWIKDYKTFAECLIRNVDSTPHVFDKNIH